MTDLNTKCLFVVRDGDRLLAADDISNDIIQGMNRKTYQFLHKQPRNLKHHQKYWVALSYIAQNMENQLSKEALHEAIKLLSGHVIPVKTTSGVLAIPSTINFSKMNQMDFEKFYNRAMDVVSSEFLPFIKDIYIQRQLENMVYN